MTIHVQKINEKTSTLSNSQENSQDIHPAYWWAPQQVLVTLQRYTMNFNKTNSPLKLKTQVLHNSGKITIKLCFSLTLYS